MTYEGGGILWPVESTLYRCKMEVLFTTNTVPILLSLYISVLT